MVNVVMYWMGMRNVWIGYAVNMLQIDLGSNFQEHLFQGKGVKNASPFWCSDLVKVNSEDVKMGSTLLIKNLVIEVDMNKEVYCSNGTLNMPLMIFAIRDEQKVTHGRLLAQKSRGKLSNEVWVGANMDATKVAVVSLKVVRKFMEGNPAMADPKGWRGQLNCGLESSV